MAKLLGQRYNGAVLERDWLHVGDDGKDRITIESIEDVQPVFESAKRRAQAQGLKDFKFVCEIPDTVITEISKVCAQNWGVRVREAFAEIAKGDTDRAKDVWKMLKKSRDYRKFQAKNYI